MAVEWGQWDVFYVTLRKESKKERAMKNVLCVTTQIHSQGAGCVLLSSFVLWLAPAGLAWSPLAYSMQVSPLRLKPVSVDTGYFFHYLFRWRNAFIQYDLGRLVTFS